MEALYVSSMVYVNSRSSLLSLRLQRPVVEVEEFAAPRALQLDAKLAEAYAVRGLLHGQYDWNFVAADKDMKRALELDASSPVVQQDLALQLSLQGKLSESLNESRRMLKSDPLNARLNLNVGWILYGTRKYNEAVKHFQQMIAAGIYLPGSYNWLAQIYDAQGRYDEAVEMDLKYRSLSRAGSSQTLAALRNAYTTGGWRAYLEKMLEQRKEVATRGALHLCDDLRAPRRQRANTHLARASVRREECFCETRDRITRLFKIL